MKHFATEEEARAWAAKYRADNWGYDASTQIWQDPASGEWIVQYKKENSCD